MTFFVCSLDDINKQSITLLRPYVLPCTTLRCYAIMRSVLTTRHVRTSAVIVAFEPFARADRRQVIGYLVNGFRPNPSFSVRRRAHAADDATGR